MSSDVLVTGGTGTLGRLVVPRLQEVAGRVRVLSRRGQQPGGAAGPAGGAAGPAGGVELVTGDLATGEGIEAAVSGVDTIVHLAGSAKGDGEKARQLVRAATRTDDAPHLVYISVVGAERIPVTSRLDRVMFGYFAAKRDAEEVIAGAGLPWTTLRATQFHDLILTTIRQLVKLPVVPVPAGHRFQPVDTGEVAARLVELALGEPAGLVPDLAGPRVYGMGELVRSYLRAAGRRRVVVPVRLAGGANRAIRAGTNLAPDRAVGRRTWEEFLAERLGHQRQLA